MFCLSQQEKAFSTICRNKDIYVELFWLTILPKDYYQSVYSMHCSSLFEGNAMDGGCPTVLVNLV